MFSPRASAPSSAGLTVNTASANSLFANTASQLNPSSSSNTNAPASAGASSGPGLSGTFGNLGANTTTSQQQQSGSSLFGNLRTNTATAQPQQQSGGLFGSIGTNTTTTQPQQAGGSLFGNLGTNPTAAQPPQAGGNLFGSLGTNTMTTQSQPSGNLFGNLNMGVSQPQGNLFGGLGPTNTQQQQQQPGRLAGGIGTGTQQQSGTAGGGSPFSFGSSSAPQSQTKPSLFGGVGQTTGPAFSGGGLFGGTTQGTTQQQQQPQGPTLSLFGSRSATSPQDQRILASTVVPGVKIDVSNLVPTTKFESCSDELKKEIEAIDTFILNQIRMCNEVSDLLPLVSSQGALVPHDVEFVQGKLETLQQALENDASDIEHVRDLVTQDTNDARLCFRALDNILLPIHYQPSGDRWWLSNQQGSSMQRYSLRSALGTRQNLLALPGGSEADSSATSSGGPTNMVEYFSQRADEMNSILDRYKGSLKEIESHLTGVEESLTGQINDLAASRSREDGNGKLTSASRAGELAATLRDVEIAILGVAGRLGSVKEQVQEVVLGPLAVPGFGGANG